MAPALHSYAGSPWNVDLFSVSPTEAGRDSSQTDTQNLGTFNESPFYGDPAQPYDWATEKPCAWSALLSQKKIAVLFNLDCLHEGL